MIYSPFFQTLHDEPEPVGDFGRGTHYSVLRVPIWQDEWLNPRAQGALLDFAVIWDEDHDERVIDALEMLYFGGLLAPVRFIGERKGNLSVLIDAKTLEAWDHGAFKGYREALGDISRGLEDPWPVTVGPVLGPKQSIIHAAPENVITYLQNIQLLWQLGMKPGEPQAALMRLNRGEELTMARPSTTQAGEDGGIPF
ncbi:MAG: hypothetical protein ACRELE_02070 [Gemmatimonadales bacterium]